MFREMEVKYKPRHKFAADMGDTKVRARMTNDKVGLWILTLTGVRTNGLKLKRANTQFLYNPVNPVTTTT